VSSGFVARDRRLSPLVLPTSVASTSEVTSSTLDDSAHVSTGTPASNAQLNPPLGASKGSSSGDVQMYIKRHVRRRLAHARENCDEELKNIINSIMAYVEERIQDMDYDDLGSAIAPSETGSDDVGSREAVDIVRAIHQPQSGIVTRNCWSRRPKNHLASNTRGA
jgi:hypothetical protein